jgi:hypothetical protein
VKLPICPDWANLDEVQSEVVRRAYINGAKNNGYDHGLAGLPNRFSGVGGPLIDAWKQGWELGWTEAALRKAGVR